MLSSLFLQLTFFYGLLAYAQSSLQLGNIPLAVKTPYLHAWLDSDGGKAPARTWPNFVSHDQILGWGGLIRVDNQAYQWMGNSERGKSGINFTRTVTSEITPSKSIFRIEAGPIQFNVTFFSPIEPNDYVRQSMPFSYMYIDGIAANDFQPHTVQVYSDISAEWVSREDTAIVVWNTTEKGDMIYHRVARQSPAPMVENGDISDDATAYYATRKHPGLTWLTGSNVNCRGMFATNGILTNSSDPNFRAVSDSNPVFSFSVDLGTISPSNQPDPVVWTIGLVRDPLVTYITDGPAQGRSAYYWSNYASIEDVISGFLSDFPDALGRSSVLDNKVLSAGSSISPEYGGILSLVTRQIFASMDITIPSAQPGQFNNSDVKIFMKDIGQSQRTNPVEVIYGAFPALLFFNMSLARDLLQPLLGFQSSSRYTNTYASPDLGASYPLVHGNSTDTHALAVENCGNMLIMAYAHAAKSGDGTLLSRYYSVLQRWADFLIENALHPREFITADGLNNPDMSNLALKGILGVYSMAKITEAVGMSNTTYMDQATQLIKEWKKSAIAADGHIQGVYGQTGSWGLMYNLFPAVWLKMGLIESSVLENQAQFYARQSSPDFGFSLDSSRPDAIYPHWTLMTAATIPASWNTVQKRLIQSIYQRAYMLNFSEPLPVAYRSSNGRALLGMGSPILGAAFAVAAMQLQNIDIKAPQLISFIPSSSSHPKDNLNVGAIVGGVLSGLAFFLLVTTAIFIFRRKRKQQQPKADPFTATHPLLPPGMGVHSTSPPAGAAAPGVLQQREKALDLSHWYVSTQGELPLPTLPNPAPAPVLEDFRGELERFRREMEESIWRITDAPPGYS